MVEHLTWLKLKELLPFARWLRDFFNAPRLDIDLRLRPHSPDTPHSHVSSVHIIISSSHGEAKLIEGSIWLCDSDYPAYKKKENLPETDMPKGKAQHFSLFVKAVPYERIVEGKNALKFEYEFSLKRFLRKPYKQSGSYPYNANKRIFGRDIHN
jgi:hypothetical protein